MRSPAKAEDERIEQVPLFGDDGIEEPRTSVLDRVLALAMAMRPHQWAKNGFVVAPLIFSRNLFDLPFLLQALQAFFLFSFTASAVYLANDVLDRESDRLHPIKRYRPIASGRLSPGAALFAAGILAAGSLAAAFSIGLPFALVLITYVAMNSLYSVWLKKIAWVDVTVIAAGFVLRVLAGALAIGVATSQWLLACTFSLALFLALGKRKHELLASRIDGRDKGATRKALGGYRPEHLRLALKVAGALSVASYFLYTLSPETFEKFGTRLLSVTVPFPLFGIWRFGTLLSQAKRASSPTEAILTDPPFLINVGLWLAAVVLILYLAI